MCNDNTVVSSIKRENQTEKGHKPGSLKDLHHRLMSDKNFNSEFDKRFNEYIKNTPTEE